MAYYRRLQRSETPGPENLIDPFVELPGNTSTIHHTQPVRPSRHRGDTLSIDMAEITDDGGPSVNARSWLPPITGLKDERCHVELDVPSVLDIQAQTNWGTLGTRTNTVTPRSTVSGIMANLRREENYQDLIDKMNAETRGNTEKAKGVELL